MCILHKWGKYSKVLESHDGYKYQFRECVNCGAVSKRTVSRLVFIEAKYINEALKEVDKEPNTTLS